jgi:hypothetical protein
MQEAPIYGSPGKITRQSARPQQWRGSARVLENDWRSRAWPAAEIVREFWENSTGRWSRALRFSFWDSFRGELLHD